MLSRSSRKAETHGETVVGDKTIAKASPSERGKGAQNEPKQKTTVAQPRPFIALHALHSDSDSDSQPLATKVITAPKRPSTAKDVAPAVQENPQALAARSSKSAHTAKVTPPLAVLSKNSGKENARSHRDANEDNSSSDELSSSEDETPHLLGLPPSDESDASESDYASGSDEDIEDTGTDTDASMGEVPGSVQIELKELFDGTASNERTQSPVPSKRLKRTEPSEASKDIDGRQKKRSKADVMADAIERPTFRTPEMSLAAPSRVNPASAIELAADHSAVDVKTEDASQPSTIHAGRTLDALRAWEGRFHPSTQLVYSPKREVRLTDQQLHIAALMRDSANHVAAFVAFNCALQESPERTKQQQEIILQRAIALGEEYMTIVQRLKADYHYMKVFTDFVEQRNSNLRSVMKSFSDANIVAEYGLVKGQCAPLVAALIHDHGYVYPGDITGKYDGSKPCYRDLIIQMLRKFFFHSTPQKPSVATQFPERFVSSVRYMEHELEIPVSMLALSCAMIKLSLDAWTNGHGPVVDPKMKPKFMFKNAKDEYSAVITFFEDIRKGSPQTYHRVLHEVYLAVGGTVISTRSTSTAVSRVIFDDA